MRAKLIVLGIVCCALAVGFLAGCCGVMMGDYPPVSKDEHEARERARAATALILLALSGAGAVAGVVCFVKAVNANAN